MSELHLDADPGLRSVYFTVLRNMLPLLCEMPLGLTPLHRRGLDAEVLRSPRFEHRSFSRTTTWHHVVALQTLEMVDHIASKYVLTNKAHELLRVANVGTPDLGKEERDLFRQAVLDAPVVKRNFVVLFTGDEERDFLTHGEAIRVFPNGRKQYTIDTTEWGSFALTQVQTTSIVWGIRLWFEQLGLLGELLVPSRQGLPADGHNILFPVWDGVRAEEAIHRFLDLFSEYVAQQRFSYGDTSVISIPTLLYTLCPQARLAPSKAKLVLASLIKDYPSDIFAERASLPVLQVGDVRGTEASRAKVADSFLRLGRTYYSHLHVSRQLATSRQALGVQHA